MSSQGFGESHSTISRVPHDYLLAVTFKHLIVVRTKVFKLSPLLIARLNRLARLNIEIGYEPFVFADLFLLQQEEFS